MIKNDMSSYCKPVWVIATTCYDAPMTDGKVTPTICARAGTGGNQLPIMVIEKCGKQKTGQEKIVRKVTPLECSRLQGFPDFWMDGAEGSDSAKYKMWGNGIALPCAADVLGRIAKAVKEECESA